MKKCNTELMKELNALGEEKNEILAFESDNCCVSYLQSETPVDTGYNYEETRRKIEAIEDRERTIKQLLAYSNATTKVDGYDMTISESLVYLAQLSNRKRRMVTLASNLPVSRDVVYDKVQYTKALYNVELAKAEVKRLTEEINNLQMAIDRTNLTNMIDC